MSKFNRVASAGYWMAGLVMLGGSAIAAASTPAGPVTVYQDHFVGSPHESLANKAPQVDHGPSARWIETYNSGYNLTGKGKPRGGKSFHPFWRANGTVSGSCDVGGYGALEVAGLHFIPTNGHIYTLTAKIHATTYIPKNPAHDGFVGFGFTSEGQKSGMPPFFKGQGPWMSEWMTGSKGAAKNLVHGNFGPDGLHGWTFAANKAPTGTLKIVLDTTKVPWLATEYYDGVQKGIWGYAAGDPRKINQVAIGVNGQSAKITDFKLTTWTDPLWNLTLPKVARPYPTFQPKMPLPARHLYVADIGTLPMVQQRLLVTLQGIVNRTQPRIYLIWGPSDSFWLRQMQKQGQTGRPIQVKNPLSLVKIFRKSIHGAVIPDPKVFDSPDVAVDIATLDNLVVATPQLAAQLHLPIQVNLRGKFKNDVAALRYLRLKLAPKMNPYLFICLDPIDLGNGAEDQIIAARGITFWVTGRLAQKEPGADMLGEKRQIEKLFAATPLGGVVRGFWWAGTGIGLGEGGGVALGSQFGKVTVVSDGVRNFSVFSGITLKSLKQKFAPAPKFDRSKKYISITISDGDNLDTWQHFFWHWFKSPYHGKYAVGWGMGPSLIDVAPTMARWYYQHAGPQGEFLADVSGIGYIRPTEWAIRLRNPNVALKQFYHWTWHYMQRMDMKTVRIMQSWGRIHADAPMIAKIAADLPAVKFLMPDYGYAGEKQYHRMTYRLPSGQVVFRAGTGWTTDAAKEVSYLASQIRRHIGKHRPAFLNVFICNWFMGPHRLYQMLQKLGPDYVDVTPSQLYTLYCEAHKMHEKK